MKAVLRLGRIGVVLAMIHGCLHAEDFPVPYNSEPDTNSFPLAPSDAAAGFKAPPGFKVTVFAAEPDVQNPIAAAWDGRGRLWVAENYTYAERARKFDLRLRDRILIFEDSNNGGHFTSRKVFSEDLQVLTSLELGSGGVWVMCPPRLLFIPDRNRDDQPDGPAEVVLDGFSVPEENYHNFANGLRWGPDGWLYGRCGASAPGDIGAPGTPLAQRIPLRGTVWRYHPGRKVFEALSAGTTNPWGHDWDETGELFFINTVNGHLWHGITGAHYVRPHTFDPNPHVYGLIDQHADHWHFDTAQGWTKSRDGAANSLGGGHAHIGMVIYQGNNWPPEYQGHLFTWNMHGRRANQEILVRSGSGYVGKHGEDIFLASDPWFRGMELTTGPDGAVFGLDWSDTGECHESTGVHRTSGRIFKFAHGNPVAPDIGDLANLESRRLVELQGHANEWYARAARLELAHRFQTGIDLSAAQLGLRELLQHEPRRVVRLRALWALWGIGGTDPSLLKDLLRHPDEHLRSWSIRLLSDDWPLDTEMSRRPAADPFDPAHKELLDQFRHLAEADPSALVRLTLASTLQRLPVSERASIAARLGHHGEDAMDHNLPLMIWYGLIPVGDIDPQSLVTVASDCELPLTRQYIARRLGEEIESRPKALDALLNVGIQKRSASFSSDLIRGLSEALRGWRKATAPAAWKEFESQLASLSDATTRDLARDLSVLFGDGRALESVRSIALDSHADLDARKGALRTLMESRPPDLRQICEQLLAVKSLNALAARGLAQFDDPAVGEELAKNYRTFSVGERPAVMETLLSRKSFARSLLEAMAKGTIPRADLTPFGARQIRSLQDAALTRRLTEVWGDIREASADKQRQIRELKDLLGPTQLRTADLPRGREIFNTTCAPCHTLYGRGGKIGPDLTGAGRDNLDYLLENIVDPSAVVNADFRMTIVELKDGRTLNGMVSAKTDRTITLASINETSTIARSEIQSLEESSQSMMPEGLLESLKPNQVRDLIGYLMTPSQVSLPGAP